MKDNWFETQFRVRYKDTDKMGVVYYGNYLTFFEIGRAELMRHYGVSYSSLEDRDYLLVVAEAAAKYHANVGYDEIIRIQARIGELKKVQLRFDYRILDKDNRLLVSGHTVHACLNGDQKLTRLPKDLLEILHSKGVG